MSKRTGKVMVEKKDAKVVSKKRSRISQTDFPNISLEHSLRIAKGIWDNYAGDGTAPHNVAMALDLSPTSGPWRNMCGASIAYGLTEGGYNASQITLTDLGRRIVGPTVEGDDKVALQEAALKPKIPGEFFKQYDRAKFPRDHIAANILVDKGIPKDRSEALVALLKENGKFVDFIKDSKAGPFVSLDLSPSFNKPVIPEISDEDASDESEEGIGSLTRSDEIQDDFSSTNEIVREPSSADISPTGNLNRVFITHGKNTEILDQIREIVELGGFEPVISTRKETTAKPIPDKVMDDMRSCGAAVIHVGSEGKLKDDNGNEHPQLNSNVLIEIGAAMALYQGRFILVVENGVTLPSNLQGLYESRYSGNDIELRAGLRILKALRGLREK